MRVQQIQAGDAATLAARLATIEDAADCELVLAFGAPQLIGDGEIFGLLRTNFPQAILSGCSTAGEIAGTAVTDGSLVINALHFERIHATLARTDLAGMDDSEAAGRRLGLALQAAAPRAVILIAQGLAINGSALIAGIRAVLGEQPILTGGLAGDGTRFGKTLVLTPDGASDTAICALGLSGEALSLSHGSFGGWEPFGPMRKITRAQGNLLLELDGQPALEVYKRYLGEYARDLPASGLLFPFEMFDHKLQSTGVIRTILGIDEAAGSLTLAGDIEPGGFAQLMHASTDQLVNGAETAARNACPSATSPNTALALLISCVGRKLVMGEHSDEEVEAVAEVLGPNTVLTGFYSYGEIAPTSAGAPCRLHNQTMTITLIAERT